MNVIDSRHYEEVVSATGEDTCAWYAVHTRCQHEKSAMRALESRGFKVFLPLYTTARQWKDRRVKLSLPLFSCYLFLRGGIERRLDLLTAPGVLNLVGSGGVPVAIEENEIEGIRQAMANAFHIEPYPYLTCGDRVRVTSGALQGLEGILIRKKNQYRLILTVEMLGKSAAVELDGGNVERVRRTSSEALAGHAMPPFRVALA
jgi:transcription antitermination factor NusG